MARLVLVRHGEPTASWGEHDRDPGLSPIGVAQAGDVASQRESRGPAPILTSPLRRAQETAAPLARAWGVTPRIETAVGEIPTPPALSIPRVDWLRQVLAGCWSEAASAVGGWRAELLETLGAIDETTIAFTHFVAINVVVGAATRDDRVWSCSPGHASVTDIDVVGDALTLVSLGDQARSRIG